MLLKLNCNLADIHYERSPAAMLFCNLAAKLISTHVT